MIGVNSRTSCTQLFKESKILTLASLYLLKVTCFIKKYCYSLNLNSNVHKYKIQRKTDIHAPSHKTDTYKKNVIHMATKLYNKMPGYVKETDNYMAFNPLKTKRICFM
jgi:hypothetical protein